MWVFSCKHGLLPRWVLMALAGVLLCPVAAAQEDEKDAAKDAEEDAPPPTDREKRLLDLFAATTKSFTKDGKLVLTYNFESRPPPEELVQDWLPSLDQTKKRVRWAQGYEGTFSSVEHGIVIGDFGEWVHKAVFLPGLEVKAEILSVAQFRPGTILALTFFNEKKKRSIGVSGGYQAVCLSQHRPAKPPYPKNERTIPNNQRLTIGYKYDGKIIESYYNSKKTSDTSGSPRFCEGFDTGGHVGFAWSGSVQSFIFNVTIEGRLDPDWVAKQLGDKDTKGAANASKKK